MKFKKILSAALATVMAASVMSVGMVSVASAAAEDPTVPVVVGQPYDLRRDASWTEAKANDSTGLSTTGKSKTSDGGYFVSDGKIDSNGVNLKKGDGDVLKLLTPSGADGVKLKITDAGPNEYTITYGETTENSGGAAEYKTNTIPENTVVTIAGNASGSTKISDILVGSGATPANYYSLSGKVTVDGQPKEGIIVKLEGSFNASSDTATTGADGSYTFENIGDNETVNVVIDATDTYFGGRIDGISLADGNVTGKDIDLKGVAVAKKIETSASFNANDLTEAPDTSLESLTVLNDYFTLYSDDASHKFKVANLPEATANPKYGNTTFTKALNFGGASDYSKMRRLIKFETNGPALIQIVGCATGASDERKIGIYNSSGKDVAADASVVCPSDMSLTSLTYSLADAGVYYIHSVFNTSIVSINVVVGATLTPVADATKAGAYVNGTDAYTLSSVAASNIGQEVSVTVGSEKANIIENATTVFESAVVDGFVFKAKDVVTGSAADDFILGTHLTDADAQAATNITTKITTTVK